MAEQQQQQQQQIEKEEDRRDELQQDEEEEQRNHETRLPSDWFYSSVMLTNRLDIAEHNSYQMNHLEQSNQSSLTFNNLADSKFRHICQHTDHVANDVYPDGVTTVPSFPSSSIPLSKSSSSQITCLQMNTSNDNTIIQNYDRLMNASNIVINDSNLSYTFQINNSNYQMNINECSRRNNFDYKLQTNEEYEKMSKRGDEMMINCNDKIENSGKEKSGNIELEKVQKIKVEDCDDGDDEGAPPSVLYSHSTTNSSDKTNWDCGVRWPSAKRTGMLTSSYSVNIDVQDNSTVSDDSRRTEMVIANSGTGMVESVMIDTGTGINGNTGEMIQGVKAMKNMIFDSNGSRDVTTTDLNVPVQFQSETNLTNSIVVTTTTTTTTTTGTAGITGAATGLTSSLSLSKVGFDQQHSSSTTSYENSSFSSLKVPIKKRLLHNSVSKTTDTTCTSNLPSTYVTLADHQQQFLSKTIGSGITVTGTVTESAFSSCFQTAAAAAAATAGSTGTMVNNDHHHHHHHMLQQSVTTTYPNLLTNYDTYGNVLNDQEAVKLISHSESLPLTVANNLSEAEIINLLCRNLCNIERIVAQQRNAAYSEGSAVQLPSLGLQCNGEQKSQVNCTDSLITPSQHHHHHHHHHHQQQQQQQEQQLQYHHHHHHYHNVSIDRRRSGTIDNSDTRRFHPYATTTTTMNTTTTTTTKIAPPTTACCSNSITVWSQSVPPSRADLKQKYLRSLAPVLYDLLTDDCESKSCQKTADSMDCSILKNCMEPFMDAYLRSLSLLAATATLPITSNKFDHLPFNYLDYFALQQCSLLLGSTPVTSNDLLKLAQSTNLLYNATANSTPTTNPEMILSDKIPFINKFYQHYASNSIGVTYPSQSSQQSTMLTVDNDPAC